MAGSRCEGWLRAHLLQALPSTDGPDDRGQGYQRGFATVTIKDADISGVVITTAPGVTVRGRVRFDESGAGSSRPERIIVQARWPLSEWVGPFESAVVGDDDAFELHDIRGPRVFRFGWQLADRRSYWLPGPILLDGRDITNVPVDFSQEPAGDLVVDFRRNGRRPSSAASRMSRACPRLSVWRCCLKIPICSAAGPRPSGRRKPTHEVSSISRTCPRVTTWWQRSTPRPVRHPTSWSAGAREIERRATRATVAEGATIRLVVTTSTAAPQP